MKNLISKYKGNLLFSLFFTLFLLIPDFLVNFAFKHYYIINKKNTLKEILITFLISLIISFLSKKQKLIFGSFFILLSIIQIGYYSYFHTYLPFYQLNLLFSEYQDIFAALSSIIYIIIFLIFAFIFLLILINIFHKKFKPHSNKFAVFLLIALLVVFPFLVKKKPSIYMPNPTHFGYLNTLFAINQFIANKLSNKKTKSFKPYIVKKVNSGKPIVIMIMGESLNYRYMHLFGWKYEDTPMLDSLKNDPHFIYKKAISSGVNTPVSVVTFFNVKREPQNINLLLTQKTNLLKLAKENGYKVYWLSMQNEGSSISTNLNYADVIKTRKDFKEKYDDALLKKLKKIDFSKKTFVVLHFRANHAPYEKYTPKNFYKWPFNYENYHKHQLFSYLDSVLYVDNLLYNIIEYMKKHHKNFVIYFTSDHAEMMGFPDEHGRYGHSQLVWGDTCVPFLYYSDKYHKNLTKKMYNHYLISKMVAKDLGYKIINPNNDGTYFVNSVEIDGSAGWIHYKLTDKFPPKKIKEKY